MIGDESTVGGEGVPVDDDSGSKVSFGREGKVERGGSVAVDLAIPGGGGGEWNDRLWVGLESGLFLLTLELPRLFALPDGGDRITLEPLTEPPPLPTKLRRLVQLPPLFVSRSSPLVLGDPVDCDQRSMKPSATLERRLEPGLAVDDVACLSSIATSSLFCCNSGLYGAVEGRSVSGTEEVVAPKGLLPESGVSPGAEVRREVEAVEEEFSEPLERERE